MSPTSDSTPLIDGLLTKVTDNDPEETREWRDSLDALIAEKGAPRTRYILLSMLAQARQRNVNVPTQTTTPYVNTIAVEDEPYFPGDEGAERTYRRWLRWNAAVMVTRAQRPGVGVGGHISSYASTATLYEVGFNHFFRGKDHPGGGDHVLFQGHASPGNYARAFIEGRLSEADLDGFRQEYSHPAGGRGLPSYPHPRRMEDFWEFPTVSMGLGPAEAIYQAWFDRYLAGAGIKDTSAQRTWAFLGDGEMDEPESRGMLQLAANQQLDNLTFVVNCNLQRLDGPVRGNGKIVQELEGFFKGAGWNVIKVMWGRGWDQLLAADKDHALEHLMMETLDGDYQTFSANDGAYVREHFFGRDPRTAELVRDWTDEEIWALQRGGNDYRKVYAAYKAATEHRGQPTVILAHTVKGYMLGSHFTGRNATHQMKKLTLDDLKGLRDRLHIPITDAQLEADPYRPPYYRPAPDDPALLYMLERRRQLGGFLPERRDAPRALELPGDKAYAGLRSGSGRREVASTMAFVQLLKELIKDKGIGRRIVPIVPDESRTFGLESLFPTRKIFNTLGQSYTPVDAEMMLSYRESASGQIMHTGINEAGSAALFQVAGTSYATHGEPMIPVYILYSMFGFQRTADQFWAAGDQLARGFIIGATAGRTTLTGEGTQHMDGHSPLISGTNEAVVTYDPGYAYEIRHIVRDALERWYGPDSGRNRDVMYYLTVYNEPIRQPAEPEDVDVEGIVRGIHRLAAAPVGSGPQVTLMASGVALPWIEQARRLLAEDWGVRASTWSVTSWVELRRQALEAERENFLDPVGRPRVPYLTARLSGEPGPFVATSDFDHLVADQIRAWVPGRYHTLGADGFGFSDTRAAARRHYLIDAHCVVVKALQALAEEGVLDRSVVAQAVRRYDLRNVHAGASGAQGGDA
ncbi:pyruvate dehydrogenase (acetyl-transferring), homodimeric type [Actinomyces sp. HMT897]|uniref:pyruvate dehydrogenase (acetyl-transferring), homodimeric type n=1 Tax=Actinomyces sp. HMT897 TaxID=2789424 RepID=UPI00190A9ABA|nr:pyruvate dehydrogenase (acetyl-transferring), homodimeric type [Actinomyces sp. HMT897]QQO78128.1 pyruvate dehydrogenase (acetyl-transferring), homodimeric type [Actinomyces sp. HMT897]